MLTVMTAQTFYPEAETIDRDPGIITLFSSLVRAMRPTGRPAGAVAGHRRVDAAGCREASDAGRRKGKFASPFGPSGALPYRYR